MALQAAAWQGCPPFFNGKAMTNAPGPQSYSIPAARADCPHVSTLLIRRSRFVTRCVHAASPEAARAFVESVRRACPGASHNCWAFVAGPPGSTARIGSSDDGEPHGTAGRPMLQILLHSGAGEICAVVSRWFGGIKLGTGGLVRAYQDAVSENLATLPLMTRRNEATLHVELDYSQAEALRKNLADLEATLENEEYSQRVRLLVRLPETRRAELAALVARISNGRGSCDEVG